MKRDKKSPPKKTRTPQTNKNKKRNTNTGVFCRWEAEKLPVAPGSQASGGGFAGAFAAQTLAQRARLGRQEDLPLWPEAGGGGGGVGRGRSSGDSAPFSPPFFFWLAVCFLIRSEARQAVRRFLAPCSLLAEFFLPQGVLGALLTAVSVRLDGHDATLTCWRCGPGGMHGSCVSLDGSPHRNRLQKKTSTRIRTSLLEDLGLG